MLTRNRRILLVLAATVAALAVAVTSAALWLWWPDANTLCRHCARRH